MNITDPTFTKELKEFAKNNPESHLGHLAQYLQNIRDIQNAFRKNMKPKEKVEILRRVSTYFNKCEIHQKTIDNICLLALNMEFLMKELKQENTQHFTSNYCELFFACLRNKLLKVRLFFTLIFVKFENNENNGFHFFSFFILQYSSSIFTSIQFFETKQFFCFMLLSTKVINLLQKSYRMLQHQTKH